MPLYRLLKVQTPAIRLKRGGARGDLLFGAHNFVALQGPDGAILREMHGIARGPGGAQLKVYGGILPFREEYIWGEAFTHRTGFYDPAFPQGALLEGDFAVMEPRLLAAETVRAAVNARAIRYPWPAFLGANSNAYYATLVAGMGLEDIAVPGQLWAPGAGLRLL